jgi:hypothetical protein
MAQNTMGNVTNNSGIITQGQTGNNIIINGPLPPGLSVVDSKPIEKLDDGTFKQMVVVELIGAYSPPRMALAMKGGNIIRFSVRPMFSGAFMGGEGNKEDVYFQTYQNPVPGRYEVTAITNNATPVTFLSQLN